MVTTHALDGFLGDVTRWHPSASAATYVVVFDDSSDIVIPLASLKVVVLTVTAQASAVLLKAVG